MLGPSLALAVVILGASPSSDPSALVNQLGSPRYDLRESAEVELAKLGRAALPALRAARGSKDLEIRTRASALLSKVEGSLLVQPTPISFDFQDIPLGQAIRSINQQAGLSFVLAPEDDPSFEGRRLNLRSSEPLPFWKAIDALCAAGQLHYIPGAQVPLGQREGTFPLSNGRVPAQEPTSDSGPFRVHLASVHYQSEVHLSPPRVGPLPRRNPILPLDDPGRSSTDSSRQFYLQLLLAAEPRLSMTQNGAVKVSAAVDDRGRSLLIPRSSGSFQHSAGYYGMNPSPMVRLRVDLAYPDRESRQIRRIKGTIPVIVATRKPEPLDLSLAGPPGKPYRNEEVGLTIRDFQPARTGKPATIELSVTPLGRPIPPIQLGEGEPLAYRPDSPQQQIEILDAEGRTLPWFPSATFYNGEETRLTLTMVSRGTPAIPATLRYHGIIRSATDIAFEFRDVPMP
jgi:hypothetical protein